MNRADAGSVSDAFKVFLTQAPQHAQAWMTAVHGLDEANALDEKTKELAYLAVLAATGLESGVPFHVQMAKAAGATRDEVIGAVLIGLPAGVRSSSAPCRERWPPTTGPECSTDGW